MAQTKLKAELLALVKRRLEEAARTTALEAGVIGEVTQPDNNTLQIRVSVDIGLPRYFNLKITEPF